MKRGRDKEKEGKRRGEEEKRRSYCLPIKLVGEAVSETHGILPLTEPLLLILSLLCVACSVKSIFQ